MDWIFGTAEKPDESGDGAVESEATVESHSDVAPRGFSSWLFGQQTAENGIPDGPNKDSEVFVQVSHSRDDIKLKESPTEVESHIELESFWTREETALDEPEDVPSLLQQAVAGASQLRRAALTQSDAPRMADGNPAQALGLGSSPRTGHGTPQEELAAAPLPDPARLAEGAPKPKRESHFGKWHTTNSTTSSPDAPVELPKMYPPPPKGPGSTTTSSAKGPGSTTTSSAKGPGTSSEQTLAPDFGPPRHFSLDEMDELQLQQERGTRVPVITVVSCVMQVLYFSMVSATTRDTTVGAPQWLLGFSSESLVEAGARYYPVAEGNALWRLISSPWLNPSILHLVGALAATVLLTAPLEYAWGLPRVTLLHATAPIISQLFAVAISPHTVAAGPGALLCSILGAWAVYLTVDREVRDLAPFVVVGLLVSILTALLPRIDAWAHLGGIIFGLTFGTVMAPDWGHVTAQPLLPGTDMSHNIHTTKRALAVLACACGALQLIMVVGAFAHFIPPAIQPGDLLWGQQDSPY